MSPENDPASPAQKPGYKTTEFYLAFLAMVLGALASSGVLDATDTDVDNKIVGLVITLLAALGYTAQRAWVKASGNKAAAFVEAAMAAPSANPSRPSTSG